MKSSIYLLAILFSIFVASNAHAGWTEWTEYTTMTMPSGRTIIVEVRSYSHSNFYPKVQWRIINNTLRTLDNAGIGTRHYRLSTGVTLENGVEGMRTIEPGETEHYVSDVFGDDGVTVVDISMEFISFSIGDGDMVEYALPRKN